jgi:transcriptional regulator with XRE-family HTH domain
VDERKAQRLTQEALAKRLGIQRSNLARFERGEQNPSLDFLIKIAVALGKEPDFILKSGEYKTFEKMPDDINGGMYTEPVALLKRIDEYKAAIDNRRPLTKEEIQELDDYFRIGLTYTSHGRQRARRKASDEPDSRKQGLSDRLHPADTAHRVYRCAHSGAKREEPRRHGILPAYRGVRDRGPEGLLPYVSHRAAEEEQGRGKVIAN